MLHKMVKLMKFWQGNAKKSTVAQHTHIFAKFQILPQNSHVISQNFQNHAAKFQEICRKFLRSLFMGLSFITSAARGSPRVCPSPARTASSVGRSSGLRTATSRLQLYSACPSAWQKRASAISLQYAIDEKDSTERERLKAPLKMATSTKKILSFYICFNLF